MPDEVVYRKGEVKAVSYVVEADRPFFITESRFTLFDPATGSALPGFPTEGYVAPRYPETGKAINVLYMLDSRNYDVGTYPYLLEFARGSEWVTAPRDYIYILPAVSKYDRWVPRVQRWIREKGANEAAQRLSYLDYMEALDKTREVFEVRVPLQAYVDVTLSQGVWEYSLPADYYNQQSEILAVDYPLDDTQQYRHYEDVDEFLWVEEFRGKYRLRWASPSAGQKLRLHYTSRHRLSHTEDTIPEEFASAYALHAAGYCLYMKAVDAVRTHIPQQAQGAVDYRSKSDQYRSIGKEMMMLAAQQMGVSHGEPSSTSVTWDYMTHHGRVAPYWP